MLSRSSRLFSASSITRAGISVIRNTVNIPATRAPLVASFRSASTTSTEAPAAAAPSAPETVASSPSNDSKPKPKRQGKKRSQSTSRYSGPTLSKTEKEAIDSKYSEVLDLLNANDIVGACKKFNEVYNPTEAFLFRNYASLQGKDRLHIQLFHRVLDAYKRGKAPEDLISISDLYTKYLEGGIVVGWMCSEAILFEVSQGRPEQGLELWVKFMETGGDISNVQSLPNKEAAYSALAAYISSCIKDNSEPVSKIATALVPLKTIPDSTDVTRLFRNGNIKFESSFINQIVEGFDKIRYETLDPSDIDFLNDLPIDQPLELEHRYAECVKKAAATGVPLTESTYSRFIFCFTESNRFERAFEVWRDLVGSGISPSVQSWNMLLKAAALSNKNQVTLIEALIQKMADSGVESNSDTYGILINAYFKAGLPDTAIEIYEKITKEDIPINLYVYNIMLNGLLRSNNEEAAQLLLNAGIRKNLSPDIISFNTFITTYIRQKKYKEIENILALMSQVGVTPNVETYTNIIDSVYKAANKNGGDPQEQIEEVIKSMNTQGIRLNVQTLTAIIDGIAKSGNGHAANLQLYRLMQKKQLRPNSRTFTALINSEIISGDLERAVFFFNEMKQYNVIQNAMNFNQIIRALAAKDDVSEAMKLFRDLVSYRYASPNVYTYSFILQSCLNINDMTSAGEVLAHLSHQPSDFRLGSTLSRILRQLERRGLKTPTFVDQKETPYAKKLAEQNVN